MTRQGGRLAACALAVLLTIAGASGQVAAPPAGAIVEHTMPAAALAGNLLGDPAELRVAVYLPPGYDTSTARRYPAVYLLHGYLGSPDSFGVRSDMPGYQGMLLGPLLDGLIARGAIRETIVVVPNARNAYFGSFYTNSAATGRWEDAIVRELVPWIDGRYRTIAGAGGRAVAGHSMGGYGAIMLAMKFPDVFGAVYALSPCCTIFDGDFGRENPAWPLANRVRSRDQLFPKPASLQEFYITVFTALGAAFAPVPAAGGMHAGLPFLEREGRLVLDEAAYASWRSKMPAYLVEQYQQNLQRLAGIYLDVGALEDFSHIRIGARALSAALASRDIPHTFEVYADGDHRNRVRERLETRVFHFLSEVLEGK